MENHQQRGVSVLKVSGVQVNQESSKDYLLEDCRNLIQVLAGKTEILYRECRFDQNKAMHIRTMSSTLAALTVLVDRLDRESGNNTPDMLKDARGFTYKAMRSCDLERISDK